MTHHIQTDIQREQVIMVPASSIPGLFRKEKEKEREERKKERKEKEKKKCSYDSLYSNFDFYSEACSHV